MVVDPDTPLIASEQTGDLSATSAAAPAAAPTAAADGGGPFGGADGEPMVRVAGVELGFQDLLVILFALQTVLAAADLMGVGR